MINRLVTSGHLAVVCFLALLAVSCSDVTDDGTVLHDGTYIYTAPYNAISISSSVDKGSDYYYADGTWPGTLTTDSSHPCIGIVFKVGAGTDLQASLQEEPPPC